MESQSAIGDRRDPGAPITRSDLANVQRQLSNGDLRMTAIETELRNNTQLTAEVREILTFARTGLRVLGAVGTAVTWLAKIGAAAAALYAAWQAARHGMPPK
jgi:hypothetical protein